MPKNYVICGGVPPPAAQPDNVIYLDVSDRAAAGSRLQLQLEDLVQSLADNLPAVVTDALEIAAYVYSADRLIRRGTVQMTNMGAVWRRDIHFKIPVRCHDVWCRTDVRSALIESLSFLSDDVFSFEFVEGRDVTGIQSYLGFSDPDAQKIVPDEVLLFSGGLDSLAGAVTELVGNGKKLALVSHQSSTQIASRQKSLVQSLRDRTSPGQLDHIAVWVRRGDEEPVEHTQRTRSFLFATLGVTIASMYGLDTVHVSENGVTTFNLPISEHVIGTRASRTTHPRTLAQFSSLFSLLLDRQISIENRYLWHTKGEVVRAIIDAGGADLIRETTSCAGVRNFSMTGRHCGVCSQCLERRFSILAAGLDGYESENDYVVDPFVGEHTDGTDLAMVEQYVLRAKNLATMTPEAFLSNYGQVFRALPFVPGNADENARRIYDLHQRHGAAVVQVLNKELAAAANLDRMLALPSTSLLAMIRTSAELDFQHRDPIRHEERPSVEAENDLKPVISRQFHIAIDDRRKKILFTDGPVLSGKDYELMAKLIERHREDLDRQNLDEREPIVEFRYIKLKVLADHFGKAEPTLRKQIERLRAKLAEQFDAAYGYRPDDNDIVENHPWQGYRLNPYVILVGPNQIRARQQMSRSSAQSVTTSLSPP